MAQAADGYTVRGGRWQDPQLSAAARDVRTAVFIDEQGIAVADEWDDDDAEAWHVVVFSADDSAIGTARLITAGEPAACAKIGRMAVRRECRGLGLGRRLMDALLQQARAQGLRHVSLHAQVSAEGFYRRWGFAPVGAVFDEVGIPHQKMALTL